MHDLVDFVSEEAELAGISAAKYLKGETAKSGKIINVAAGRNVSYVLPQKIRLSGNENVKLFFRVTGTFRNCTITALSDGNVIASRKKKIAVPGEMETMLLTGQKLADVNGDIEVMLETEGD